MRENQRKSRAKRQEYVRELEQRLGVCKEQAQQKDIEHRLAIQKVEAENRHLRMLLGSLGLNADLVQQYVQMAGKSSELDRKIAIPAITRPSQPEPSASPSSCNKAESCVTPTPTSLSETQHPEDRPPPEVKEVETPSLCDCSTEQQSLGPWPAEENVLNSTICSLAEEMIRQHNDRGTDIEEIRRKLWAGFRKGKPGDGCRVQNNILFQILDEISSGI